MDKFYILNNRVNKMAGPAIKRICSFLKMKNVSYKVVNEGSEIENKGCLVVLGGDGTVLRASHIIVNKDIPILGVNLGSLGYLSEVPIEDLENALDRVINDDFTTETRSMLSAMVFRDGKVIEKQTVLNDVFFERRGHLMVMKFENYVNGEFLNGIEADGEIISTATGSTAYSLSAGGPIVTPESNVMILTAVCPHALNSRSIIFKSSDELSVVIGEGRSRRENVAAISFDGSEGMLIKTGDRIVIKSSRCTTKLIKLSRGSFLEVLRMKMKDSNYLK